VSEERDTGRCAGCGEERELGFLVPAWGMLCDECSDAEWSDEEGNSYATPTPEQARIAALEGALREVRERAESLALSPWSGSAGPRETVAEIERLAAEALGEEE
jgi:pyruvate carboxylase